jgi:hypothetical protein
MIALAINKYDAVRLRKALPKCSRGCDTADAATENENGL